MLFNTRIDEHKRELRKIANKVSGYLKDFSGNSDDIGDEFAVADVKLRHMQKAAAKDLLKDIKTTRKMINKFNGKDYSFTKKNQKTEEAARKIRTELNVIIEELGNVGKELLITGK